MFIESLFKRFDVVNLSDYCSFSNSISDLILLLLTKIYYDRKYD